MPRLDLTESIGSLLNFYRRERNIFGRCPHCHKPFRLSEVKLTYGKEPPRDLLTRLQRDRDQLAKELETLEAQIQETEEEHTDELEAMGSEQEQALDALDARWTDKVDNEVDRLIHMTCDQSLIPSTLLSSMATTKAP